MAITLKHVAEAANVSTATASLVLSGRDEGRVGAAARERVHSAARRLGYRGNSIAQGLRTQRSRTIGFISDRITTTPFAVRMVQAAQSVAWERGVLLFLLNTDGDVEVERSVIRALGQRQVEGMVYASMAHRVVDPPEGLGPHAVLLNARARRGDLRSVVPDEFQGAYDATTVLIDAGHRRIGFLFPGVATAAGQLRLAGHRRALADHRIPYDPRLTVVVPRTTEGSAAPAAGLLTSHRPTAIFSYNDRVAAGVYRAASALRIEVPSELSVVGFDDQEYLASALTPALTTVALPYEDMARWAMNALFDTLDGKSDGSAPFEPHLMPCRIVPRDSVAPVS